MLLFGQARQRGHAASDLLHSLPFSPRRPGPTPTLARQCPCADIPFTRPPVRALPPALPPPPPSSFTRAPLPGIVLFEQFHRLVQQLPSAAAAANGAPVPSPLSVLPMLTWHIAVLAAGALHCVRCGQQETLWGWRHWAQIILSLERVAGIWVRSRSPSCLPSAMHAGCCQPDHT